MKVTFKVKAKMCVKVEGECQELCQYLISEDISQVCIGIVSLDPVIGSFPYPAFQTVSIGTVLKVIPSLKASPSSLGLCPASLVMDWAESLATFLANIIIS